MAINVIIICIVALAVAFSLRRDFDKGVAAAVFFLILLPREVQIPLPGALPELTGHRVVLLVLLFSVWPKVSKRNLAPVSAVVTLLCLQGVCRALSTFSAIDAMESIKVTIDFWFETVIFFILIASALRARRTIDLVARSALAALFVVAAIGAVEKYTGRNLAAEIVPNMADWPDSVTSTFRHRILFGYAVAMGFPIALALRSPAINWKRWLPTLGVLLLLAACYFGHSRGPWVGCALGAAVLAIAAGRQMRRKLVLIGVIGVALLASRPGVYDSISSLWSQSFDQSTVKGRSTDYRRILWTIAYQELTKSIDHTLFGYGGHSTELLDVSQYFDQGAGGTTEQLGHSSWDSQLASDLMQFGFLGFAVELLLYFSIFKLLRRACYTSDGPDREFMASCLAAVLIFYWAMTTVAIFNQQLYFLFWAVVAIAGRFDTVNQEAQEEQALDVTTDSHDSDFRPATAYAE